MNTLDVQKFATFGDLNHFAYCETHNTSQSKHKKEAKKKDTNGTQFRWLALWLSLQNDSELWNFMEENFRMRNYAIIIDVCTVKHIIDSTFLIYIHFNLVQIYF